MSATVLPDPIVPTSEIGAYDRNYFDATFVVTLTAYLLIVYKIGPSFMKSRPAFNLKNFITVYNIYQILACCYLAFMIYNYELPSLQIAACIPIQNGTTAATGFDKICKIVFILKFTELSETVVFVLRKKQQQVSFLHVFHHATMLFLSYNIDIIYRNSASFFPVFLNSCVHIVMYTYYLLAAVLPSQTVARLTPLKKSITILQMVQFTIILMQVVVAKGFYRCEVPVAMLIIYTIIIIVIFYGFYDFYKNCYNSNKKK